MRTKHFIILLFFLTVQKPAFSQNKDIEISVDKFLRLNYNVNHIIPDEKGISTLDYISSLINQQKIPDEYYICWQVNYLKCEKEKDSLIEYKRLDYLLKYIEAKHNIKRHRFKVEFFETEFYTNSSINFMVIKPSK